MKRYLLITILVVIALGPACGQESAAQCLPDTSAHSPLSGRNLFSSAWGWFSRWRDRAQISGFDPGYVGYPKTRPWLLGLYGTMAITSFDMTLPDMVGGSRYRIDNTTGFSSKLSLGLYYTGWGFSVGPRLSNKSDFYFSFSSYGRVFGFDIKLDHYRNLHSRISWANLGGGSHSDGTLYGLTGPEMVLMQLNTYFVFNARKFSYASALSQTTWQRRSAGSMIAGLSYNASYMGLDADFFEQLGPAVPYYADTLHVLSHNVLGGVGYAYNKVWGDGKWMLHASLLPMVRWSYFNDVEINPRGSLADWPEVYRRRYEADAAELRANAAVSHFSLAAMLRLAAFWNISERWVAGSVITVSQYWGGFHDGMKLSSFDWIALIYGGYRF